MNENSYIRKLIFAFMLSFGGVLWLNIWHRAGGMNTLITASFSYWIWDSLFMLLPIFLTVWLGSLWTRKLFAGSFQGTSAPTYWLVSAALLAICSTPVIILVESIRGLRTGLGYDFYFFISICRGLHTYASLPIIGGLFKFLSDRQAPLVYVVLRDAVGLLAANFTLALVTDIISHKWKNAHTRWSIQPRLDGSFSFLTLGKKLQPNTFLDFFRFKRQPLTSRDRVLQLGLASRTLISGLMIFVLVFGALPASAPISASAAPLAASPACLRNINAEVVALDQTIVYNRLGAMDPEGMIFALRSDVVDKAGGNNLTAGNVMLRPDKRPRPLTLRMNVGDCLAINFQNLLNPTPIGGQPATRNVGISVLGMQLVNSILNDGSNVGRNAAITGTAMAGLVVPGGSANYSFFAEREGTYELYNTNDDNSVEGIGTLAHGLFGAINVEPTGAEWYRSQVTRNDMDLAITGFTADGHPIINYDAVYPTNQFLVAPVNVKQTITNNAAGGTFTLSFGAGTTSPIAFNADAATLQGILEALPGIGPGNIAVTGTPQNWTVEFIGSLAGSPQPLLVAADAGLLVNGASTTITAASNNIQTIVNNAVGGTFTISFGADTTTPIAFNADAITLQTALEALLSIGAGNITVTGAPQNWTVEFVGSLAGSPQPLLTATDSLLISGGATIISEIQAGVAGKLNPAFGTNRAGKPILKMLDGLTIFNSDLTAVITGPGRGNFIGSQPDGGWYPKNPTYPKRNEPFREFTIVFHDEAAMVQAFQVFNNPDFLFTLHGVRDGKAINYGTGGIAAEVLANRFGVGPSWNCPECKLEEFFLTSWALGDPAMVVDVPANTGCGADCTGAQGPKATKAFYPDDPSNVYHTYINDHTKFRNLHVGKEHHIFHLHSHQWLETPDDDNSSYLDSQAIGPGASYTYEIAYGGSGNRNKTPGDAIFHCHFYPHFAQGMWAMWRNHDVFERGTELDANGRPLPGSRALPDGEITAGTPIPALVPIPDKPMAPMPGHVAVVADDANHDGVMDSSQIDLNANGIPDYLENWPVPSDNFNPGYPFYIPGVAGHRPPTPALDMTDPANGQSGPAMDGGLPRHVITGGTAVSTTTPLDLSKLLETASAVFPAEAGTPAEQLAMDFHAQHFHSTFLPNGTLVTGANSYETNGLPPAPGAPFAEPCRNDDGTLNSSAPLRVYKAADIQLDMKLNKLGWHFPQARMLALWQDVGPMLSGKAAPQPFVMRANSGDCLNYYHTNLIPSVYEQDAYQVRTPTDIIGQHIHLVKFDVTASDGSGNGFNYEDGTLSPDEVRERIAAIRANNSCAAGAGAPDSTTCPVAAKHPFFGPGPNNTWLGARTTIQRWWADPVINNAGQDRTLGNVYTHDHYGPSTHQQTGLYATLTIEPTKSLWRDSETGVCYGNTGIVGRAIPASILAGGCTPVNRDDGGPTNWRADILTVHDVTPADPTKNYDKQSFREFYVEFSDFQHAYVAGTGATLTPATVKIGGVSYNVSVAAIRPDALYAINPAGAIQNTAVSSVQPWLKVKPTLEGQANKCPTNPTMSFIATGCPETISTADIGTFSMNYRNEPVAARVVDPATMSQAAGDIGDLSLAFSSNLVRKDARLNSQPNFYPPLTQDIKPGDPYTPIMRTYEADKVRIKVQVGATEEGHNASLWTSKWLQEYASPNSGWRNSQMMGISEQFNWDAFTAVDPTTKGNAADYLFSPDNSVDGMWNGMWSLLRSYSKYRTKTTALGTDLLPLPNNRVDLKKDAKGNNIGNLVSNLSDFDSKTKYQCPLNAPKVTFNVTAVLAKNALPNGTLVYNARDQKLQDPTAIMYVRSSDLDATGKLKAGVPIEPLVLRAKAGDCMTLNLKNNLPATAAGPMPDLAGYNMMPPIIDRYTVSSTAPVTARDSFNANDVHPSNRVGLRPQLVAFDPTRGAGNSVGANSNNTVAPGGTLTYYWYAGDMKYDTTQCTTAGCKMVATPIEFGATNLISSDPIKHSDKGAIGALIIEPVGSTWVEDAASRASATVTYSGGVFRDFVLLFQDDVNMRFGDGSPVPFVAGEDDSEDSGMKGLNYRSEPLWFRLGISPLATENIIAGFDFTNALANSLVGGDPQTPVFIAGRGQEIRLRVLEPNGHGRNHVFVLHGHVWQRNPYTSNCTGTPCLGSTSIGNNPLSEWRGAQEGHGPSDHWDIVPQHGAGGAFGVPGDYLFRDMAPFNFYNGVWGILRVQ